MEEYNEFQKRYMKQFEEEKQQEFADNADLIQEFIAFCKAKGLELTESNFDYTRTIGIMACYPNIVGVLCPQIPKDKEGLNDFQQLKNSFELKPFMGGYLYAENFMLMAHPYFRRSYYENNNWAPRFVDLFWRHNDPAIEPSLAMDYDRVRINVDTSCYMEEDTWFGPDFDKKISQITDGTVQLRPPADLDDGMISFLFSNVFSLDIKWETKGNIKSFQAEEFKTEEVKITKEGRDYFPARYIHAEFDLTKDHFRHFDGAMHLYTAEEYFARRDSDFNYNSKNNVKIKTASEKLFKFNGIIPVETWMEYTGHFLSHNSLVTEYFEGKYPDQIADIVVALRKNREAKQDG